MKTKCDNVVRVVLCSVFWLVLLCGLAIAHNAVITVSKPLAKGVAMVEVTNQGVTLTTSVFIEAKDTAEQKRDKLAEALRKDGYKVTTQGLGIFIDGSLPEGATVKFHSYTTGENPNEMEVFDLEGLWDAIFGCIDFYESFSQLDPNGQSSVFTAGVGNDRGEYTVTLKSDSIADLSATGVAHALYNQLSTNLPEGISLTLVGPTMRVKFDPAFTKTTGAKLVFGTTSALGGVGGSLGPPIEIIPTISEWGLIIMAGVLLTAGVIVIARRRRRVAA